MQELGQNFILRTKRLRPALVHDQDLINAGDGAGTMSDDDDDAFAFAHAKNCARECFVSFGVEVGIRLVENHQEWIAVDGAGERDPLRLPGG